jgi:hypothetical protein
VVQDGESCWGVEPFCPFSVLWSLSSPWSIRSHGSVICKMEIRTTAYWCKIKNEDGWKVPNTVPSTR